MPQTKRSLEVKMIEKTLSSEKVVLGRTGVELRDYLYWERVKELFSHGKVLSKSMGIDYFVECLWA